MTFAYRNISHFLKAAPLVLVSCVTFDADTFQLRDTGEPPDGEDGDANQHPSPTDDGNFTADSSTGGHDTDDKGSSPGAGGLLSILDPSDNGALASGGLVDPGTGDDPAPAGGTSPEDPNAAGGTPSVDPAQCPDICTGGCEGDVCTILCADKPCDKKKVHCPPTHNCELDCFESACRNTELKCDQQQCLIHCRDESCKGLEFLCQNATCELFCGAEDSCQDATMKCSKGAICMTYVDCEASTPAVSCDNSSCELAECEDD